MIPKLGFTQSDLTPSNAINRGISGADLVKCGRVKVNISCNGITVPAEFYVTRANSTLVLGLEFCRKFELVAIAPVCTHPAEAAHRAKLHQWTKQLVMWTQNHSRTEPSVESFAEHLLREINSKVKNPVVEKVETIGSVACPLPPGQHPVPVWRPLAVWRAHYLLDSIQCPCGQYFTPDRISDHLNRSDHRSCCHKATLPPPRSSCAACVRQKHRQVVESPSSKLQTSTTTDSNHWSTREQQGMTNQQHNRHMPQQQREPRPTPMSS